MRTNRFPSYGSLRGLAARRRRGHLAGGTWLRIIDRDLDRIGSDLLFLSQADPERRPTTGLSTGTVTPPVDLHARRAQGSRPVSQAASAGPPHARAS